MKLIPRLGVNADRHFHFCRAAVFIPRYGHHSDVGPNCRQGSRSRSSGEVADAHFDEHLPLRQIGKDLRIIDPNASRIVQFDLPDDSVPTATKGIGNAVRVGSIGHKHPVIDANRQSMTPGRDRSEIVNMRRNQARLKTNDSAVNPNCRDPVRTFESQHDPTAYHVSID